MEIKQNETGQYYMDVDGGTVPEPTIIDTSTAMIKEADKEVEIELDLDYLRQALASNCSTGKMTVKVIGKEVSLFNKIMF